MHAWDCRCGTRNAPSFTRCRSCGQPARLGRPIHAGSSLAPISRPAPAPPPAYRDTRRPAPAIVRRIPPPLQLALFGAVIGVGVFLWGKALPHRSTIFTLPCGHPMADGRLIFGGGADVSADGGVTCTEGHRFERMFGRWVRVN
jgi:hypothetical protein